MILTFVKSNPCKVRQVLASGGLSLIAKPKAKPNYARIDRLERELLDPPYLSELPRYQRPTTIERVWR